MTRFHVLGATARRLLAPMLVLALAALPHAAHGAAASADGATPPAMAPGAPAGSYAYTGFEQINFFSGKQNFSLPLHEVHGRGDAKMTVALQIQQHWSVKPTPDGIGRPVPDVWGTLKPGYGPGIMEGRAVAQEVQPPGCVGTLRDQYSLTRLTFTAADGTEYDFRDDEFKGAPVRTQCVNVRPNRKRAFRTWDGSFATFVSDTDIQDPLLSGTNYSAAVAQPSGYMTLRDGTRYRIELGKVQWMRDRNGNRIEFFYEPVGGLPIGRILQIRDSLNRNTSFVYDAQANRDYVRFFGFGGALRTIEIRYANLDTALVSDPLAPPCAAGTVCTYGQLFPEFNPPPPSPPLNAVFNPRVVSEVVLPNGRAYRFRYNQYGELEELTLPSGGVHRCVWAPGLPDGSPAGVIQAQHIYRRVIERRVYGDGGALESRTTIGRPESWASSYQDPAVVDEDVFDATDNRLRRTRHIFRGSPWLSLYLEPTQYPVWSTGKESRTETYDGALSLLRATEQVWAQRLPNGPPWWTGTPEAAPSVDPRIRESRTILETGELSSTKFLFDAFNNKTQISEYDFGAPNSGSAGPLLRRSQTDFATWLNGEYYPGGDIGLTSLPLEVRTYDGSGTLRAQTNYEYDVYDGAQAGHAALVARPGIVELDAGFAAGRTFRGNVTAVTQWLGDPNASPPPQAIKTYDQFDVAGNVVKSFDGRGFATTADFADRFGAPDGNPDNHVRPAELGTGESTYALVGIATNALNHRTKSQFDYYTGDIVDAADANDVVTSSYFDDPLERPTRTVRAPSSGADRAESVTEYDDVARIVTNRRDLTSYQDRAIVNAFRFDTLGREVEARAYVPSGYVSTLKEYDALSRVSRTSAPFRPPTETPQYDVTKYDALGHVVSVTTPDGAVLTNVYAGRGVLTTDQAGTKRLTTVDARGRVVAVVEDPSGLGYTSTYTYNAFDKLATATQGGQVRTFVHDFASRLQEMTNPESGTTKYAYDANGNLTRTEDARHQVVETTFDALNRPEIRRHFDSVTPNVLFLYDQPSVAYSKGRLTKVSSDASASTIDEYDRLGRVKRSTQTTAGRGFSFKYAYDLDGNLIHEEYPSGRTTDLAYDLASRPVALRTTDPRVTDYPLVDSVEYASHGLISKLRFGNDRWERRTFNVRQQPWKVLLGAAPTTSELLELEFGYGTTNNSGAVRSQDIRVGAFALTQTYTYDPLNRLETITESRPAAGAWSQTFHYDRYGNRAVTGTVLNPVLTPQDLSAYDPVRNQLVSSTYDPAGNVKVDAAGRAYGYDAEGRQTSFQSAAGPSSYSYDGSGRRVRRDTGGVTTLFVYDAFGRLAVEQTTATAEFRPIFQYLVSDPLGSTRLVLDGGGSVLSRHDYLPFGEEIPASFLGRDGLPGYGEIDGVRQKFTGKERDDESGNDYFGARYLSGAMGRFLSVDPAFAWGAAAADPQQWNRYAYVRNSPTTFVDPDGRILETAWDVANIVLDVTSLAQNIHEGHYGWAAVDAVALVVDAGATALPFVPGGAGAVLKATRTTERFVEGAKTADRMVEATKAVEKTVETTKAVEKTVETTKAAEKSVETAAAVKKTTGGETALAKRGREAHKNYETALGSSYEYNKALPSGKRPDAINWKTREVRELKPGNPRAVRRGQKQVEGYKKELEALTGEKWTSHVDTYKQ